MKKITLILCLCFATSIYAQFNGPGFYRLKNNFTADGTIYLSHDGAPDGSTQAISASAAGGGSASDTTVFQFVEIGSSGNYDIVINTGDYNLRANSTTAIQLRAWDGNGSTANPEIWTVRASGTAGVYNILTPNTSSERFLVYNALSSGNPGVIGYSGSDFTRTQWIIEPFPPLSTTDFDENSIFVSNPVDNEMIINGLDNKVNKIEVFDLLGKSVIEKNTKGASSTTIDANALTSGLYLVKLYGETSTLTKKVIKR